MAGVKGKSGGKRPGAGRPCKTEGCTTTVMRVPSYMKERIDTLIRIQAEWISEDEGKRPVGYLDPEEEKRRRDLIQTMEGLISYEKERLAKAFQLKKAEEEERLQMKLVFPED